MKIDTTELVEALEKLLRLRAVDAKLQERAATRETLAESQHEIQTTWDRFDQALETAIDSRVRAITGVQGEPGAN